MNYKILAYWIAPLLLLNACASEPKTDYDLNVDFSTLKQFSQLDVTHTDDPLSADRITQNIKQILTQKGFIADAAQPDFLVTYAFKTQDKPKDSGLSIGLGTGTWGNSGGIGIGTSVGVPLGSDTAKIQVIQIDILDPQTQNLIWRGSDSFDFDSGGQDKAERTSKAVTKILSTFPPTQH